MEGGSSIRWAFNTRQWRPAASEWSSAISYVQADEKERITRFMFRRDAKSALAGRLLLRRLAADVLGVPWAMAEFTRTAHGRPSLVAAQARSVDFNVSHQGAWAVLAAEGGGFEVGVDVMEVAAPPGRPIDTFLASMRRQFSVAEWKFIADHGTGEFDRLAAFYRLWCLKESVIKATGHGLTFPLNRLSFTPAGSPTTGSYTYETSVDIDGTLDPMWHFQETMIDPWHPVAVALHGTRSHPPATHPPPFRVLTYEELTSAATSLTSIDPSAGQAFVEKEEKP